MYIEDYHSICPAGSDSSHCTGNCADCIEQADKIETEDYMGYLDSLEQKSCVSKCRS